MGNMTIQNNTAVRPDSAPAARKITEAPKLGETAPSLPGDQVDLKPRSTGEKALKWLGGTAVGVGAGAATGIGGLMLVDLVAGGQFGGEGTRMALLIGGVVGGISGGGNAALSGTLIDSPAKSAIVGAVTGGAVGALMGKNLGGKLMALTALTCAVSGAVGAYASNRIQH
ncbi:MAG: hypothetical protein ACAI44_33835 [Candidatus Sericytochromatia bacterium]